MIVAGTGDNCGGGIESLWEAVSLTSSPERYYVGGMKEIKSEILLAILYMIKKRLQYINNILYITLRHKC